VREGFCVAIEIILCVVVIGLFGDLLGTTAMETADNNSGASMIGNEVTYLCGGEGLM
jgi:hypothetical protein